MFLLKIANTSNFTRARCLLQKNNHFTVRAVSHRFYSKQDKPPTIDQKVKKLQQKICISARKPPTQVDKSSRSPGLPCSPPDPPKASADSNEDKLWADVQKNQQKKYRSIAIVGLLLAAAALGSIFYSKKKNSEPKLEITNKKNHLRPKPMYKVPEKGKQFPKHVPYLLIGGGTASFAAFRAIKSADPKAQVLVISNECNNPYMRPPLSKEMWFTDSEQTIRKLIFKQWNGTERSLFYEPQDFYTEVTNLDKNENGGVAVALGWNVNKIDVYEKKVILEDDTQISYDKCLIATGASPKNLEVFEQAKPAIKSKVTLFREIFDFQKLNEVCDEAKTIAIVGGGFLGSELACALGRKGKNTGMRVYQIFKEPGNMGKILPEYLSAWTTVKVKEEGVQIVHNAEVEDVSQDEHENLVLHLNNGKKLTVDHVIVSIGVKPNTKLAETSELEVDPELGGYLVNTEMEARSNLYVAGDCSCFYDTKLGRRRVEHHDHAVVSGRLAGENMTGANKPYLHQSMFWSDLGPDVGYEAIGIVDSTLPTVGVFAKASENDNPRGIVSETNDNIRSNTEEKAQPVDPNKDKHDSSDQDFGKGVIFYLKDNTVVGIVLWNVFNRMSIARQVLKDRRKYDDLNEVAKLFNIHDEEKAEAASAN